jgi:hypothetical protein
MSTAILSPPASVPFEGRVPARWIIPRREDLTWFIRSALAGYLALGLMAAGVPIFPIFLVWLLLVDGPHVLSTVTRTYFDKAERARLGWHGPGRQRCSICWRSAGSNFTS